MVPPAIELTVVAVGPDDLELRLVDGLRREGIAIHMALGPTWPRAAEPLDPRPPAIDKVAEAAARPSPPAEPREPSPPAEAQGSAQPPVCYLWFPKALSAAELASWCAELDRQTPRPGVLAIAEASTVEDLLAAGADDAVARSISERELVARVRALHRRVRRRTPEGQLRHGALTIDTLERTAWIDGTVVGITPIEQAVLVALIRAGGRALTRMALLDAAWGEGELEVSERAVDNVVLRLRRKLPRPDVIETVRGVGFRLASPAIDVRRRAGV